MHALEIHNRYILQRGGWTNAPVLDNVYKKTIDKFEIETNEKINGYLASFLK